MLSYCPITQRGCLTKRLEKTGPFLSKMQTQKRKHDKPELKKQLKKDLPKNVEVSRT